MYLKQENYRTGAIVSLLLLSVLTIGAAIFYKERLFADSAYISFHIINSGHLHYR